MSFVGIKFNTVVDEGTIALVHHSWLTPLKKEVWWPSYKTNVQYKKALSFGEKPKDTWSLCGIKRILFSCDDLNKAYKKLIKCEDYSDTVFPIGRYKKKATKTQHEITHSSSEKEDMYKPQDESIIPRFKIISSPFAEKKVIHASVASEHISEHNSTLINQECKSYEAPHLCSFVGQVVEEIKNLKEEIKKMKEEIKNILRQPNKLEPSIAEDLSVKFILDTFKQSYIQTNPIYTRGFGN